MPNPKRRHSHQRTALRRTNYTATLPEISPSKQNSDKEPFHLNHNATPDGYYKGRRLPGFKSE